MTRGRDRLPKTPQRVRRSGDIVETSASGVLVMDYNGDVTLTSGTGLQNDDGTLKTKDSEIVHDSLSGFVANEHINWTNAAVALKTSSTGRFDGGLVDSSNSLSVDLVNHQLQVGAAVSLDWSAWSLYDGSGNAVLDWDYRYLYDENGKLAAAWQSADRTLIDSSEKSSVDWGARLLYEDTGLEAMLDWSTGGTLDFKGHSLVTGTLTLAPASITDSSGAITFDNENLDTTGNIQCNWISLGSNGSPSYPLHMKMAATDDKAFYVDGTTADYTGVGTGFAYAMEFSRDHAVADAAEPCNMYTMLIANVPKHANAVISDNKYNYSIFGTYYDTSSWTVSGTRAILQSGVKGKVTQNGSYTATGADRFTVYAYGLEGEVDCNGTFVSEGAATFHEFYGMEAIVDCNPASVTGSHYFQCMGIKATATATTEGVSWTFGGRFSASGGDTSYGVRIDESSGTVGYGLYIAACANYGIWDASGKDWVLGSDAQRLRLGTGLDFEIVFDGTYGRLDATGDPIRIGDDTTNCLEVKADGEINLHGTARTTNALWVDAGGIKAPGAKPATAISHGLLELPAWSFANQALEANEESVSFSTRIPERMDRGVAPQVAIGWSSTGISPGNCKWELHYLWTSADEDTTAAAEATASATTAASATSDGLTLSAFTLSTPSAMDVCLHCKLVRASNDAADTIAGTVELHGTCFDFTSNKLGKAT